MAPRRRARQRGSASWCSGETKAQVAKGTELSVVGTYRVEEGEASLLWQIQGRERQDEAGVHLRLRPTS